MAYPSKKNTHFWDNPSLHKIADDLNRRGIVAKRDRKYYASTIKAICDNVLHEAA
jgi:hypothetical protein